MTVVEVILLLVGGMPLFDSLATSFGTAGTGGFGIKNNSIAFYDSYYLQGVITVFMILFGINFNVYYLFLIHHPKDVFGIEAEATDIYGGKLNAEGYKSVAKQLADKFHFEKVAITLRESHNASENGWSAMLYDVASGEYCFSKKYELKIIDRVGGGDSFGGGLIYALLNGKSTQDAVEFAVAASALKHTIEGDYNMMTVSEVEKLAGGDGSGRIQR